VVSTLADASSPLVDSMSAGWTAMDLGTVEDMRAAGLAARGVDEVRDRVRGALLGIRLR
jgi:hypothetical protein